MVQDRKTRGNALRWAALASASLLALPAHAGAVKTGTSASLLGGLLGGGSTTNTSGPVKPFYGNVRPFYGNVRPFYGNLRPFYGNVRPFWGNIRPFWGDTGAFYGDLKGFWAVDNPVRVAGAPDYAKVGDFWATTGTAWDQTFATWGQLTAFSSNTAYQPVASQLKGLVDSSRTFWGSAVQAQTGKSFDTAFAKPLLSKYGIDLDNPGSLKALDQTDQALFFLDWYDGLMNYAGTDHVDWWMKTVNWTPALTRTQESGGATVVGLLDQTVMGDATISGNVIKYSGVSDFTDGHGAGVASLIVGAHDGKGVMGIAPNAAVVAYNPYDSTGSADWSDIAKGVQMLKASGANVVNASLGVPGKTLDAGWDNVFSNLGVMLTLKNTVFVMAAGNEGVTQSGTIHWNPLNPAFIVVGSVGLDGQISNFSNRPGNTCLATLGLLCLPGQQLKNNFIVAPGELILVSDGKGGTTRQIGTSFAAPLVSGAVALIQDRWPWLANHPHEVVNIILDSAKDLGAPGVDEVYGHGLLDVEASQSPLSFDRLVWFTVQNGRMVSHNAMSVAATYENEQQKSWDTQGAYFYAFEPLGLFTQRDFAIPLSSKLVGQNVKTYMGGSAQFQAYLLNRIGAWADAKTGMSHLAAPANRGFFSSTTTVPAPWGGEISVSYAPRAPRYGFKDEGPAYQSAMTFASERSSMTIGFGDGAAALAAQPGFTQAADYDGERGGANPLLGFASGGAYAGWSYALSDRLTVSGNVLSRDEERDTRLLPQLGVRGNGAARYGALAQQMSLSFRPSPFLTFQAGYTRLHEATGLLGVQSFDADDFRHGSTTDGYSLGASWGPTADWAFAATGTLGHTRASDGQALEVAGHGLTTSSWEVAASHTNLFAKGDRVRLALSQPLHVERGRLAYSSVQVIDRSTGELGVVRDEFSISSERRLAAELLYGLPTGDGSQVTFFSRVESQPATGRQTSYIAGAGYRIAF